jgi:dipeptidyl aminopeptidase/acylaminoacyl peptidase
MSRFAFRAAAPALIIACIAFPANAQTAAQPAHDPRISTIIQTLGQGRSIRETDLSPDGNSIAWNVSGPNGGLKVAPLNDPAHPRDITACAVGAKGRESGMAWSPDSKHLAFFSDCTADKQNAIFLADPASSTTLRLLAPLNGFAKDLQWSPDGKLLGFLYVEGATRPSGALAAMKPPSGVIGVEGLEIQRVAAVDPANGQIKELTPDNLHVYEFDWSPDSQNLAYIAAPPPGENNWWVAKLYTQPKPIRAITKGGQVQW